MITEPPKELSIEEVCNEFARLGKKLTDFSRPDRRTESVFDECSEALALAPVQLKSNLTPTQIAQLEHAYVHFMDTTVERMIDVGWPEDGKIDDAYLEDICLSMMYFAYDLILHPEKYPVKED